MKNILFLIPRMGNGGAERVLATIANELASRNYLVTILTLTTNESFYDLNNNVKIIGANYEISKDSKIKRGFDIIINGIKSIFFLSKFIRKNRPDVLISFLTHTNLLATIMKIKYSKLKIIVSERAEPRVRGTFTKIITRYLYPLSDIIVCQSSKVSLFFPDYSKPKIRVIENPINTESLPKEINLNKEKVIVGVGRLFEQKNFSLLIDSFSEVLKKFPYYSLDIYGEGPLRTSLQDQINRLGLSDKITLKGVRKNVMNYISNAELFVMSSNFEGFPNALVEAMATGLPVISTDFSTGVAKELIKDQNGIVVPVNDKVALQDAIIRILDNSEMRKNMSKNNFKIRDVLSVEKITNKWEETINEII